MIGTPPINKPSGIKPRNWSQRVLFARKEEAHVATHEFANTSPGTGESVGAVDP